MKKVNLFIILILWGATLKALGQNTGIENSALTIEELPVHPFSPLPFGHADEERETVGSSGESSGNSCNICLDNFSGEDATALIRPEHKVNNTNCPIQLCSPCLNTYAKTRIDQFLPVKCPLCRGDLSESCYQHLVPPPTRNELNLERCFMYSGINVLAGASGGVLGAIASSLIYPTSIVALTLISPTTGGCFMVTAGAATCAFHYSRFNLRLRPQVGTMR